MVIAIGIDAGAAALSYGSGVLIGIGAGMITANPVVGGVIVMGEGIVLSTLIDKQADELKESCLEKSEKP